MPKRIILCSLVFCLLLVLPCCGRAEVTAEDTLKTMYSVSEAFLNVHYDVTMSQAEEYKQLQDEIDKARPSLIPGKNVYNLEDYAPDLVKRYKALIKQKYQTQPVTDKGFESIELNSMCVELWKMVLKKGSDIEVTSVKTSLRNKDIDDKKNQIDYTINFLFDKTYYEITGVLTLVLVDNKWMIDDIYEFTWSPKLSY
jgi:hypothetical protein